MKWKWLIAGLLIVLMAAACAGSVLALTGAVAFMQGARFNINTGTISAQATEEQRLTVDPPAALEVTTLYGDIDIVTGAGSDIVVTAHKTAWGNTQAEAEAALKDLEVVCTQTGNKIVVEVKQPPQVNTLRIEPGRNAVNFVIRVPAQTEVKARSNAGSVALEGTTGMADLESDFGDVTAIRVIGALRIHTNSGRVTAQQIQAGAETVDITSDYGDIRLDEVLANTVRAQSSSGIVEAKNVSAAGKISLLSGFGNIAFMGGQAETLELQVNSGETVVDSVAISDTVTVHSDYGAIRLRQVAARAYDLSTNSGDVRVEGAQGKLKASSEFGRVEVVQAEAVTLDLRSSSGDVEFSGSLGDGPHTLKTSYGNITLALPETTALEVDLSTDFGKIKSDFEMTLSGDLEAKHWVGVINGGSTTLAAQTNSGNITLEKLKP